MKLSSILVTVLVALCFFWQFPAEANRTIVVGVPEELYITTIAGVQGWNATGEVKFLVQPTGCGTGNISFCYEWSDNDWLAWYVIEEHQIYVNTRLVDYFSSITVCHELGHSLGLYYHSDDPNSCLYDKLEGTLSASPNAEDVENYKQTQLPLPQQWLNKL
jgi:hypothetical protein